MGLSDAILSTTMTSYCSAILPIDMSKQKQELLLTAYHWFLGMLNWLSISTCPNLTTAYILLTTATTAPTQGHLDAIWYVSHYIKATADYRISFSSRSNDNLESFITFPLPDNNSSSPFPEAFTDANWGPQFPHPRTSKLYPSMKPDPSLDISSFSPVALLSENATKKHALVIVPVKLKSRPLTNVQRMCNRWETYLMTLICSLLCWLQFATTTKLPSSGATHPAQKACITITFMRMLSEKQSMNTRKYLSTTSVVRPIQQIYLQRNTNLLMFSDCYRTPSCLATYLGGVGTYTLVP